MNVHASVLFSNILIRQFISFKTCVLHLAFILPLSFHSILQQLKIFGRDLHLSENLKS